MYYDGKRDFYIKQYGPKVLLAVCSVLLVACGTFIYLSTTSTANKTSGEVVVASENLKDEKKIATGLPEELSKLNVLEKSNTYTVDSVTDNGEVIVNVGEQQLKVVLIGDNIPKKSDELNSKISEDLKGKEIKLAFDEQKTEKKDNSKVYAYIYINDTLYNATLLENGSVTLKDEKTNKKLLSELTQAQAYAKQNALGVWAK